MSRPATVRIEPTPDPPRSGAVVLLGQPNVGKSALFGALTRRYVTVSNYPGTTVEICRGKTTVGGMDTAIVDTPGVGSFVPSSEDERVARDMLLQPTRAAIVVGDSKALSRSLSIALQLIEMELPCVVCLNMSDEARESGIVVDREALAGVLGVDVVPTVAIQGEGIEDLRVALESPRTGRSRIRYAEQIEQALTRILPLLPDASISARSLGLMVLAGDETLTPWLQGHVSPETLAGIEDLRRELQAEFSEPVLYHISRARIEQATSIAQDVTHRDRPEEQGPGPLARRLDWLTLHPVWGVPFLGAVLYIAYLFVGVFGAGTLVGLMENGLFGQWVNPATTRLVDSIVPWSFLRDLLVGPYGIVTMALTYALALILPIVGTFFIAFGVLEDSGYLPRLAVILNRAFKKMGLNGKAVLPMVLGLGCDTMATMTTRILETRKERLIVIVLLSLGVPCSAQLAVILAMLSSVSTLAVVIWLAVLVGVILVVGTLAARILPGKGSDFIVELPPLRVPKLSNVLAKTVARIEWYLKEAVPLFVLGTVILFLTNYFGLLEQARRMAEPVVNGWLGLPRETAEAFLIGFLRRDFGAAGLYQMTEAGALDAVQVLVAAVTITLFIPCIAQFFMTVKERGWRTGLAVATFVFSAALGIGAMLNWTLRALAVTL